MTNMVKCPTCKGKKTVTCTIVGPEGRTTEELECLLCMGKGEINTAVAKMYRNELDIWCNCDNPSESADYHPDNERGALVRKHHWTCHDCGKVLQVG